jgi:excisionase family DNA binding protein
MNLQVRDHLIHGENVVAVATPRDADEPAVVTSADASATLLDVRAVASLLGCSIRHVYRLADAGRMPRPLKLGALNRWSRSTIEKWIASGCPRIDRRASK